jgi:acetylornithine deacetylase
MCNRTKLETKILKKIDEKKDDMTDFLQKLVRIPSVVGHEGDAQKFIEKTFTDMELQVDVWEPDVSQLREHSARALYTRK